MVGVLVNLLVEKMIVSVIRVERKATTRETVRIHRLVSGRMRVVAVAGQRGLDNH